MLSPQEGWKAINIEAEQALLGALLLNNNAHALVSGIVTEDDFGEAAHAYIYRVMGDLIDHGKTADIKLLSGLIQNVELAPGIDLKKYLARLAAEATTIVNAPDYARHIRELADRRRIAAVGATLVPREDTDSATMAAGAIDALDEIASRRATTGRLAPISQAVLAAVDAAAKAYQLQGLIGISFGIKDLDLKTGGMSGGDLIVIAGRPGMGKSAFALSVLRRMAEAGKRGLIASLEMSEAQIAQRMISDLIFDDYPHEPVPYFDLAQGRFHDRCFSWITDAGRRLSELPIVIDDRAGLSIHQIAARARQRHRKEGLDVLIIDHLDLIKASDRYKGNRVYEIMEVTAAAKGLAKELNIPVLLLAQLSREVEKRDIKRPMLSDLRSSGSIEQDADTVMFLFRNEYYLNMEKPEDGSERHMKWIDEKEKCRNRIEVLIAKQRMGPAGHVDLFCNIGSNAVRSLVALDRPPR